MSPCKKIVSPELQLVKYSRIGKLYSATAYSAAAYSIIMSHDKLHSTQFFAQKEHAPDKNLAAK